jgi:acyl-CoA reductase-like NAD-dependent aldehyde dehydrogenase
VRERSSVTHKRDDLTQRAAMNPQSTMGTVISVHHLQRIHSMVETRRSGTILTGGEPLKDRSTLDGFNFSRGSFYPPTVIADVGLEDALWKEEVFGPVVVLRKFEGRAEISFYVRHSLTPCL